eukprot:TRINITY_DN15178_c0_g1_i1.p2 TRINITY_DN15178_c0_g1~~TRINITY_DN15178_c0_g1_i1.p2  ORF type:complete len:196 (+),score=57.34 TRINITY_DN15178_c0_g1_i1:79-666(+)
MPLFDLVVSADFENVHSFGPSVHPFRWYVKLKCPKCGETGSDFVYFDDENEEEVPGGRGKAHFQRKCPACAAPANLSIVAGGSEDPRMVKAADNGGSVLLTLECRGCEPVEWSPQGEGVFVGFAAKPAPEDAEEAGEIEQGNPITDITFEEGEWCGYEEATELSLMISNLKATFQTSRAGDKDVHKLGRTKANKK